MKKNMRIFWKILITHLLVISMLLVSVTPILADDNMDMEPGHFYGDDGTGHIKDYGATNPNDHNDPAPEPAPAPQPAPEPAPAPQPSTPAPVVDPTPVMPTTPVVTEPSTPAVDPTPSTPTVDPTPSTPAADPTPTVTPVTPTVEPKPAEEFKTEPKEDPKEEKTVVKEEPKEEKTEETPAEEPAENPVPTDLPTIVTSGYSDNIDMSTINLVDTYEQTGYVAYDERSGAFQLKSQYTCETDKYYGKTEDDMIQLKEAVKNVVDEVTTPEMSDLEKYYTLSVWLEENVKYSMNSYYNTKGKGQTAYDAMFTGESVCAGRARLYSLLCHQAGLACIVYSTSDHMYCVLPNVNGQTVSWEPGYFYNTNEDVCEALGLAYTSDEDNQFAWGDSWGGYDFNTGNTITLTYDQWIRRNVYGYDGLVGELKYTERGSGLNGVSTAKYTADMDIYDYGLKKK